MTLIEGASCDFQNVMLKGHSKQPVKAEGKPQIQECAFYEQDNTLYLDVIRENGLHEFVHEENGRLVFQPTIQTSDGNVIEPCKLQVQKGSKKLLKYVGIPRADLIEKAPLLTADELYSRIEEHVMRYADLPPLERTVMICYVLYTWFFQKVATSPYLRFIGDTGTGKSRMLKVFSNLSFYPIKTTGSSSQSGMIRLHERFKGTMIIDEGDLRGTASSPIIKFLNCGFEKGAFHILTDHNDYTKQEVFDPFGPKIIAMREPFQDIATEGRCLSFTPYETSKKSIPSELDKAYEQEVDEIQAAISVFVMDQWAKVDGQKLIDSKDLNVESRLIQMMRPVSIVLQFLPDKKKDLIEYIEKRQGEIKQTRSMSWEGIVFSTTYELACSKDDLGDFISSAEISDKLGGSTTKSVTRALLSMEFIQESHHYKDANGKRISVRKLVVPTAKKWQQIVQRYYHSDDEEEATPECPKCMRSSKWIERV